jgi:hypothetical protein
MRLITRDFLCEINFRRADEIVAACRLIYRAHSVQDRVKNFSVLLQLPNKGK